MATGLNIPLGAPGILRYPDVPLRALTGVRMDVCAFFGVARRGPAREPVLDPARLDCQPDQRFTRRLRRTVPVVVESFDEYRRLYGAFEGPGLLPYAVASFFEQGGRRAYVARIVHQYATEAENEARVAVGDLSRVVSAAGPVRLRARNEGTWGNALRAEIGFTFTPLHDSGITVTQLTATPDQAPVPGALLRLTLADGSQQYRSVPAVIEQGRSNRAGFFRIAIFEFAAASVPVRAEIVEAIVRIDDSEGRSEQFSRLGLSSVHPRWMAYVLCHNSQLVTPDESWVASSVVPDEDEPGAPFAGGEDAYAEIIPGDFFDESWTFGDDEAGDGVTSLSQIEDVSMLVAPDLYSPAPLVAQESIENPVSLAGPEFERCFEFTPSPTQEFSTEELDGLRLDPLTDLDEIIALQVRLADFASLMQGFVALLDVPPGITQRQILTWRANFDSSYAAAYFPWLTVARRDDRRDSLIRVPPSAVAAGIVAQREIALGVPYGPANVIAAEVVDVDEQVSPPRHDELHPQGINVYQL